MEEEILGGRLEIDHINLFARHIGIRGALRYDEGMVELVDHMLAHYSLYLGEIHDHTLLWGEGVVGGHTLHGDKEFVRMAVDVPAFSIVCREGVSHLKRKLFG